ncbi:MFS transporter [Bacillus sp. FJAT-49736]|uniref:MFS transporter n=1 Tax=Bacillus sp. FJAT-49736 TaxID=2833582 RepID=UPI001BC98993|nr:MFS transporter [Bacillus sp. FJAT-49736]MBS4173143.1 MFS transporter [Bacillus sp. FJAT-49736]
MEHVNDTEKTNAGQDEMRDKRWAIVSIASIPLIMTLGNSMLIPVLPLMEKKLDISKMQSSLIITVYSIVAIFLIPIAGYLSDRFGRKIVIIPSLILAGVGGVISAWAAWKMNDPFTLILIGRILQGAGAAGAAPIVLPLVGDMFRRDSDVSATLGVIETSNTFGKVLSPILGSLLAGFIWFLPFASIPVFCLISVLAIIFLVKKPKDDKKGPDFKTFLKNTKEVFRQHARWLIAVFVIGAILMFVLFAVLFYLSSVLEDRYHYHGVKKGFILAIPLACLCLSSFITGKKIKDNMVVMKWITFIGLIISGASVLAVSFSDQFIYLTVVFLICGIGIGAGLPCLDALITQTIEKNVRGTITSFYSSMRYIGVAAGPPVMAFFMKSSIMIMFMILAVCCVVAAIMAFVSIKPNKENEQEKNPAHSPV